MRKNISLAFLVLALTAMATLLLDYQIRPVTDATENKLTSDMPEKQMAPDFSFIDIKNDSYRLDDSGSKRVITHVKNYVYHLSDFKGKIVILHFWATWCAPCVKEFPKLTASVRGLENDIVVLAISSDDQKKTVRDFIRNKDPQGEAQNNVHLILDEDRKITHDLYQTFAYPETIIIDREGRMVRKIPGDADWTGETLQSYLKSLAAPLAESPPKP